MVDQEERMEQEVERVEQLLPELGRELEQLVKAFAVQHQLTYRRRTGENGDFYAATLGSEQLPKHARVDISAFFEI